MNRGRSSGPPGKHLLCPTQSPGPAARAQHMPYQRASKWTVVSTGHQHWPHISSKHPGARPDCTTPPLHVPRHQGGAGAGWSGVRTLATPHGSIPGLHTLTAQPWASHLTSLCPQAALPVPADSRSLLPSGYGGMDRAQQGAGHLARSPGCSTWYKTPSCEVRHSSDPTSLSAFPGLTHGPRPGRMRWQGEGTSGPVSPRGSHIHPHCTFSLLAAPFHMQGHRSPGLLVTRPRLPVRTCLCLSPGLPHLTIHQAPAKCIHTVGTFGRPLGRISLRQTLGHCGWEWGTLGGLAPPNSPVPPLQSDSQICRAKSQPAEL